MEDAMHKEKQISQMTQVSGQTSNQVWDANSQVAREPSDDRVSQANSPEMDQINKEHMQERERQNEGDDLKKQSNPVGFQTEAASRGYYSNDKDYNVNNTQFDNSKQSDDKNNTGVHYNNDSNTGYLEPNKVMEQVKDMATGAAGLAAGAVSMAAGVGKVMQETAKATMQNVKEMMPNTPSLDGSNRNQRNNDWKQSQNSYTTGNYQQNNSGSLLDDTAKMMKETTEDLIHAITKPSVDSPGKVEEEMRRQHHDQRQRRTSDDNSARTAYTGDEETQETSRGKQFSEHRQNASLL
jgi:hypothetical protein